MDLVSSRNIEEMVLVLKKEVSKTHNVEHEDTGKYRQLLVRTLHSCCIKVRFLQHVTEQNNSFFTVPRCCRYGHSRSNRIPFRY